MVIVAVIAASSALAAYEAVTRLACLRPVPDLIAVAVAAVIGFTGNELLAIRAVLRQAAREIYRRLMDAVGHMYPGNAARGAFLAMAAAAAALLAAGCAVTTAHPATPTASLPPDPPTGSALLKIATAFNHDYDTGDYGLVYARWDARSQAIITRADYIQRHRDCPASSPALSQTESVSPGGPQGSWLVHYQIGGQQLTDYWFYVHRRWVFDLVLSNPDAVELYRMSPGKYAAAVGCNH